MFNVTKRIVAAAALAFSAVTISAPAQAIDVTLLQFTEVVGSKTLFTYTNNTSTPGAKITSTSTFNGNDNSLLVQLVPDPLLLSFTNNSLAKVVVTAAAASNPVMSGTGAAAMAMQSFSGSIQFILKTAQVGTNGQLSTNALTVNFQNAMLSAATNTRAPTLQADIDAYQSLITYSSAFGNVSKITDRNFSLSFSQASTRLAVDSTGRLPNFVASGTGTFSGAVPEPATWAMSVIGFGLLGSQLRRRRQKDALAAF